MFQIKVEQGGITNIEPQKSSKAEPPELEENLRIESTFEEPPHTTQVGCKDLNKRQIQI